MLTSSIEAAADSASCAIESIVRLISPVPDVERVILFGSRAIGDAGPRSDIDLAISAPAADVMTRAAIMERIEAAPTLLSIDIVWLDQAPDSLRARIERDGLTLFERERT